MLNDAACFKAVYIVCDYTDLHSGMDQLAALIETQTGNRPYTKDILYLFCGRRTDRIRERMVPVIQAALRGPVPVAAQPGGSARINAAAVPVADGGADDHPEGIGQAGEAAGIHGMNLCRTENFSGSFSAPNCSALFLQNRAAHREKGWGRRSRAFSFRDKIPGKVSYRSRIRSFNHRHYDECLSVPDSQRLPFSAILETVKILGGRGMALEYTEEKLNSLDKETLIQP